MYELVLVLVLLSYTCTRFFGTINRSLPTSALPVALIRFSPLDVRGRSVVPVCRPLRDHSVSPWRIMKQRGAIGFFARGFFGEGSGMEWWDGGSAGLECCGGGVLRHMVEIIR